MAGLLFVVKTWHVLVGVVVVVAAVPVAPPVTTPVVVVVSQGDVDGARVLNPLGHRPVSKGLADP